MKLSDYQKTDPKCIRCGERFPIHKLRKRGKWAICADCDRAADIAGARFTPKMRRVRDAARITEGLP